MNIAIRNKRNGAEGEYVGRPSPLGNPFRPRYAGIGETLERYEAWLKAQIARCNMTVINELRRLEEIAEQGDLTLVCWCDPAPCHASVIKHAIEQRWVYRCYRKNLANGVHITVECGHCKGPACRNCDDVGISYLCDDCCRDIEVDALEP